MKLSHLASLSALAATSCVQAKITIQPLTDVNEGAHKGYFSDPFHVPYKNQDTIYLSGTSGDYLECDSALTPECGKEQALGFTNGTLQQEAENHGVKICGNAGVHPYQTDAGVWHAVVTLHVNVKSGPCGPGLPGWSLIVHAAPNGDITGGAPPTGWTGDQLLIGSWTDNVKANYDGKYYKTPGGQLYLVYQKLYSKSPHWVGVAAQAMDAPKAISPDEAAVFLLYPDEDFKSEDYTKDKDDFKLIETGNIRYINGKFVMAYSVGAYNHPDYKIGIAYSDTFLPQGDGKYRKVIKDNPNDVWNTTTGQEVWYLLQSDQNVDGWRWIGDQVIAPGVPTVAPLGANGNWILIFAGYDPSDHGGARPFPAKQRRPYFTKINMDVPMGLSVNGATDAQIRGWMTPVQ